MGIPQKYVYIYNILVQQKIKHYEIMEKFKTITIKNIILYYNSCIISNLNI